MSPQSQKSGQRSMVRIKEVEELKNPKEEKSMPKVGSRSFPYSPAGQQQAAAYAKSTGQPLSTAYKGGGKVKKAKGGRVKAMAGGMKMHNKNYKKK